MYLNIRKERRDVALGFRVSTKESTLKPDYEREG
jgi:hypothetical protein